MKYKGNTFQGYPIQASVVHQSFLEKVHLRRDPEDVTELTGQRYRECSPEQEKPNFPVPGLKCKKQNREWDDVAKTDQGPVAEILSSHVKVFGF